MSAPLYRMALPMVGGVRPTLPAPRRLTDFVQLVTRWLHHQVRPEIRICVSDFSGLSAPMDRVANTGADWGADDEKRRRATLQYSSGSVIPWPAQVRFDLTSGDCPLSIGHCRA